MSAAAVVSDAQEITAPTPARRVRVMIVEDSRVLRELLILVISRDPRLEIVAVSESGEKALQLLESTAPDVISMDIRLPGISGLETTRRIMAERPTPIVVVAANIEDTDLRISINALRAGALSVVEKPAGSTNEVFVAFAERLCTQLTIMSQVKVVTQRSGCSAGATRPQSPPAALPPRQGLTHHEVIGIVASTGGPSALVPLLSSLGSEFAAPVLLVQHMTSCFNKAFIEWLGQVCGRSVVEARAGDRLQPGVIHVAPSDCHLTVRKRRLQLDHGPLISMQRPSGTVLFRSMAEDLGPAAAGVVLTGMGDDGAHGLKALRDAGGYTIAEHASTAIVYGMPGAAVTLGAACESLPLSLIAPRLRQLVRR